MMRCPAAFVVLAVILYAAAAAAQTCPPGVPMVQCFADPCRVRSEPCPKGTTCRSNYCGGCNSECVPEAASGEAAPPTKCSAVCNMMCIKGTACSVDPVTCKASCKPVAAPTKTTPAAGKDAAPRCPDGKMRKCPDCNKMCMRGYTCSVDPCTCQSSCKPTAAPKKTTPAAVPAAAPRCPDGKVRKCPGCNKMCRRGYTCSVDPCTCKSSCKPVVGPKQPAVAPKQPAAAAEVLPTTCQYNGCAAVRCISGTRCVQDPNTCAATCVRDTAAATPAATLAPAAAPAALSPPSAKCVNQPGSCAVARCIAGTTCMEDADCRAQCVPDTTAPAADKCANSIGCAATTCLTGTECRVDPNTCQASCVAATKA